MTATPTTTSPGTSPTSPVILGSAVFLTVVLGVKLFWVVPNGRNLPLIWVAWLAACAVVGRHLLLRRRIARNAR